MRARGLFVSLIGVAFPLIAAVVFVNAEDTSGKQWRVSGQNLSGTRNQRGEHTLTPANVHMLKPKWVFTTGGDVSATPTVADDAVYFPDWAGFLYAVDKNTGQQIWAAQISTYTEIAGDLARTSPVIYGDELIFGDNQGMLGLHNGANLIAVNRFTGELRWITQIETHPAAIVTGPAVVFRGLVYQGVSSIEEGLGENNTGYPCCTFRGSMVAVDARNGRVRWKTYTVPPNGETTGGYSGGSIWQQPVIDPLRGLLYAGTGNNYTAPATVVACQAANPAATDCAAADDYFDTVLAMDLHTGVIRWSHRLWDYDVWPFPCSSPCSSPVGPDFDFGGSGGNLTRNLIGFGQKSGIYWALNPANGSILWGTLVGPGGIVGGIEWGTATDGRRIYVASANSDRAVHTLTSGQTITWGSWCALDVTTGKILWQTADPTPGALDTGALSVANGVVFAGSPTGYMYALDAATGKILWSFNSGGSVIGGPSIVDGVVYWGSGYGYYIPNNKLYAFSLP